MIIVLLGYMASGKSTLGKVLAERRGCRFLDLDEAIVEEQGMSIPEIFENKGEIFFRKKETEVLRHLLAHESDLVLALGGGTPCYGINMQLVNEATPNSFYLKYTVSSLVARVAMEKQGRPLVARIADGELPEFIGKHLFERSPFYNMATHSISGDGKSVEALLTEIEGQLV